MPYTRVVYKTKDIDFDYVPGNQLEVLIARDEISHFYRPAEKRWVSIKFDAVRGEGGDAYQGPERRRNGNQIGAGRKEAEASCSSENVAGGDWIESLWRQIEKA